MMNSLKILLLRRNVATWMVVILCYRGCNHTTNLMSHTCCHAYTSIPQQQQQPSSSLQLSTTVTSSSSSSSSVVKEITSDIDISKSLSLLSFPSILPPPSDVDKMNHIIQSIHDEYQSEIDQGFQTFGIKESINKEGIGISSNDIMDDIFERKMFQDKIWSTTTSKTSSSEFRSFSVSIGDAGPDETYSNNIIQNGNCIYQTQQPIISNKECDALIQEAKNILSNITTTIQVGQSSPDTPITNYELGEVRVSQLLHTRQWLQHVLHTRFFPMIASRFGIPIHDITLQDGLIIGYGYQSIYGSKAQPIHRDSCLISINIALSSFNDYTDGGTYFEGLIQHESNGQPQQQSQRGGTIKTERGHAICHLGGISHAGRSIGPNGERWVLVLFCIVRNIPEYARRCHARGMVLSQQKGNEVEAKLTYQTGLCFAPNDHLLLTSLGRTYIEQEEKNEIVARNCLALAAQGYTSCMKANLALGRMMLSNRRPRAALRRFDTILNWLNDRDINVVVDDNKSNDNCVWETYKSLGYDARYYGAQAALISAREAKRRQYDASNSMVDHHINAFDWKKHVNIAVERCHIALRSTPDDSRLHGMLSFAENLLVQD